MIEIRWHGRGGQGTKSAVLWFADIVFKKGKYVQGFPEYGPERTGAPLTAYNRLSDRKIKIHSNIYNPDYIVIVDETQIDNSVIKGIKENTIIIANSEKVLDEIYSKMDKLTEKQKNNIICIPAIRISRKNLGNVFPNIPMLTGLIYILKLYEKDEFLKEIEEKLKERFIDREELIIGNLNAVKETWEYLEQNYN
ncbi:MAG: 2-oxoacid:acceptor oxidoreductase family protein [Clostridiales bacterium]|nr:2-oxoacid:acceptor oxidoreductase family protein [Clostridiales bacterium]